MPLYTFTRLIDGEEVTAFYPMRLAPSVGKVVKLGEFMCRRTVSVLRSFTDDMRKFPRYPYRARSQAKKEHLPQAVRDCSKFTKEGHLIVRGPKHEARIMGIMDMTRV